MRKILWLFGLLLPVAALGVVFHGRQGQKPDAELARARVVVGTKPGRPLLARLAERLPENAEVYFLSARQLDAEGDEAAALVALERAAALGWPPPEIDQWRWLVVSRRDFRRAEPYLQAVLDRDPNNRHVRLALAAGYRDRGRLKMAEELISQVLDHHSDDGPAHYLRGIVRLQSGYLELAGADLKKAVALGPDQLYFLDARVRLALCLRSLRQYEAAYHVYEECRDQDPENLEVLFGLGQCARGLDRPLEAMQAYQALLRRKPNDLETLLEIVTLYQEEKQPARALDILRDMEKHLPDHPAVLDQLAKALNATGDAKAAAVYRARAAEAEKKWSEQHKGGPGGEIAN